MTAPETLFSRLRKRVEVALDPADPSDAAVFLRRLDEYGPTILELLGGLYSDRDDYEQHLVSIFRTAVEAFIARPAELKALDAGREANPTWYQSHDMMGAFCYVDLFAGDFTTLREKIPYFRELGLTYLHLMPFFKVPPGPNDGGYAVSSYREVRDDLGTMADVRALAADLREAGISLVVDFVFNHTASDHTWAERAKAGDPTYRDYYYFFPDREMPDAYERTLREIFPDEHPGQFTWHGDAQAWVWTTFHSYQWDLNYRNPAVFRQMLEEMLFLANVGAEGIRLDAVAFLWKEMGTASENLPQAHAIIQAYNRLVRIAAPAMIFKSEAIVHPADVVKYFGTGEMAGMEAEIGYNPLLMVELWEAMATTYSHLLSHSMRKWFNTLPPNAAWVNYVRSHDDIGWGFADEDAQELGIHGFYHRQYLNRFYTGETDDSYAVGLPFQFNPKNLDMRISGTTASLNGLEQALEADDAHAADLAVRRILLMYSVVLSMSGIPLLNLGDEIGLLNDYSYRDDDIRGDDSRWVHRVPFDWERAEQRTNPSSIPGRIFIPLRHMIQVRKRTPAFAADADTAILDTGLMTVYGYHQAKGESAVVCLCNFHPEAQTVDAGVLAPYLQDGENRDLIAERRVQKGQDVTLAPYEMIWLPSK